jgi:hypothetical protein
MRDLRQERQRTLQAVKVAPEKTTDTHIDPLDFLKREQAARTAEEAKTQNLALNRSHGPRFYAPSENAFR